MTYLFKRTKKLIFLLCILSIPSAMKAMCQPIEQALYAGMNYKKIFDQQRILAKYPEILIKEGLEIVECDSDSEDKNEQEGCLKKTFSTVTCNRYRKKQCTNFSSSDELEKALVEDYTAKKVSHMKRTVKIPCCMMGFNTVLFGIGQYFTKSDYGSGTVFSEFLKQIATSAPNLIYAIYSIWISPIGDPLEKFEILYAKRKRFLPHSLQEAIELRFSVARLSMSAARQSMRDITKLEELFTIALNLPVKSKKLKSPFECRKEIGKLLVGYDKPENNERPVARAIIRKFNEHYNRYSEEHTPLDTTKTVLYIYGPPGVGKTYITKRIAELMTGTKVIKISAEKIIGDQDKPGELVKLISKADTPRNAIIFIDEIDKVLNGKDVPPELYSLLEPDEQYFHSPFLNIDIDISHFCFVMAGNDQIEDSAIRSRLTKIKIDWISKEKMKEIIYENIKKKIVKNEFPEDILYEEKLKKEIDELINSHDPSKGLRELKDAVFEKIGNWSLEQDIRWKTYFSNNESDDEEEGHDDTLRFRPIQKQQDEMSAPLLEFEMNSVEDKEETEGEEDGIFYPIEIEKTTRKNKKSYDKEK